MWLVVPRADRRSLRREALLEVLVEDLEEPPGMSSPPAMLITIHHRPYEHHMPPSTHHYHYSQLLITHPPTQNHHCNHIAIITITYYHHDHYHHQSTTYHQYLPHLIHPSTPLQPHIIHHSHDNPHRNHISAFYRAHSRLKLRTTHCRGPQRGEGLNRCIVGPHKENQPNAC